MDRTPPKDALQASPRAMHSPSDRFSAFNTATTLSISPPNSMQTSNMPVPFTSHVMPGNSLAGLAHGRRVPSGQNGFGIGRQSTNASNRNTKHVPCKFFKSGQCTAGDACPFSHSVESVDPCKYYLAGKCKYGNRCSLPHPGSGRRVDEPYYALQQQDWPQQHHDQFQPPFSHHPRHPSQPFIAQDDPFISQMRARQEDSYLALGSAHGSPNGSAFGSPRLEARLAMSPSLRAARALDAPLPESFDSQEQSNYARFGPSAASLPTRFAQSPKTSAAPTILTAEAQPFGNLDSVTLGDTSSIDNKMSLFGSSPPLEQGLPLPARRIQSEYRSKPQNISFSQPTDPAMLAHAFRRRPEDDEYGTASLSLDLLSAHEKMLRFSRADESNSLSARQSVSSFGSPKESKVGSPTHASPPQASRFAGFFASRGRKDEPNSSHLPGLANDHVGSPLRNSTLNDRPLSTQFQSLTDPNHRERPPSAGTSSLTAALKDTSTTPQPKAWNGSSSAHVGSPVLAPVPDSTDRTLSESVRREGGDEELVFSMEEEEDSKDRAQKQTQAIPIQKSYASVATPAFGAIGSKRLSAGAVESK